MRRANKTTVKEGNRRAGSEREVVNYVLDIQKRCHSNRTLPVPRTRKHRSICQNRRCKNDFSVTGLFAREALQFSSVRFREDD